MNTVDRIMSLADDYAGADWDAEAEAIAPAFRTALLTAVQKLAAERDDYQVAADKLAGQIKDMQRQEPVAWALEEDDGNVYDCVSATQHDGTGVYNVPLYTAAPQPAQEPKP